MDQKTLYEMAKSTARQAEKALVPSSGPNGSSWDTYYGYPALISTYNALVPFAWQIAGDEARALFPLIDLGPQMNPMDATGIMARSYAELVAARLGLLANYLSTGVDDKDRKTEDLVDFIGANLRAIVFTTPSTEIEVQNALEALLRGKSLDYRREKVVIPYSSKVFIPDFTIEAVETALEVKLCPHLGKERDIVGQINEDIPAYHTRYRRLIFVVYDLGYIRDEALFKSGIEDIDNVYVLVVKN